MRVLESTFSCGDSVLGIHSGDLAKFRATADLKSSSTLNFAKSPTSNTAIPRILEEESQSSLRDFALAKSWQSISAQADSSKASKAYFASAKFIDCHATASALARNDDKNAKAQKVDSRICDEKPLLCERVQGRILGRM